MNDKIKSIIHIGVTANIIEWYGFCLTAYLSMEFGKLFFNTNNTTLAILLAISTFSLSYLARPFGGVFFGYIGDYYGRSVSLKISTLLMIIPTVLIGLLPIYDKIGLISTILLIFLRLLQGFCAGGELPGSACYVYESSNINNRTILCSSISISSMLGVLLGSLMVSMLHAIFSEQEILQWAWRLPFLLAVPLMFWIFNIRKKITEPGYSNNLIEKSALIDLHNRKNKSFLKATIQAVILTSFLQVCFYVLFIWFPVYLEFFLKISPNYAHVTNTIALFLLVLFTITSSYISKFLGHKIMIIFCISAMVIFSYPLFSLLFNPKIKVETILMIQIAFAFFISSMSGIIMEHLGDLFPSRTRSRGMGISFTFASSIFGGTAPTVCTLFINSSGIFVFPSFYIIIFGCASLICTFFI